MAPEQVIGLGKPSLCLRLEGGIVILQQVADGVLRGQRDAMGRGLLRTWAKTKSWAVVNFDMRL